MAVRQRGPNCRILKVFATRGDIATEESSPCSPPAKTPPVEQRGYCFLAPYSGKAAIKDKKIYQTMRKPKIGFIRLKRTSLPVVPCNNWDDNLTLKISFNSGRLRGIIQASTDTH